jgi:hypothetical protein
MAASAHQPDGSSKTRDERDGSLKTRDELDDVGESPDSNGFQSAENIDGATIEQSKKGKTDLERIRDYLKERKLLHLLEKIPKANKMVFEEQTGKTGQLMKLLVGYHKESGNAIYAHMVQQSTSQTHKIFFFEERPSEAKQIPVSARKIGIHRLLDPFSKTIPSVNADNAGQGDRARITCMVNFYFVAEGIAKDVVLKERQGFAQRFGDALIFIDKSMGLGAVETPNVIAKGDSDVNENDNQSILAGNLPCIPLGDAARKSTPSLHNPRPSETSTEATPEANANSMPPPRTAKRTVDAQFAELSRMSEKERELTLLLDGFNRDLEVKDNELNALRRKREEIEVERDSVRDSVREQVLNGGSKRQRV